MSRRRIAYPLGFVLFGVAVGISWSWGVPGTVNGATIAAIAVAALALLIVANARRDDETPTRADLLDRGTYPATKPVVHYLASDPVKRRIAGDVGDRAYVCDPHTLLVREQWVHTGKGWKLANTYGVR